MNTKTNAQTIPFGAITFYRVIDTVDTMTAAVVAWHQDRQTRKILMSLSETQLADIGYERVKNF